MVKKMAKKTTRKKLTLRNADWEIYIPAESDPYGLGGHWPIAYRGKDKAGARRAYLKWAKRKRLPAGSYISNFCLDATK